MLRLFFTLTLIFFASCQKSVNTHNRGIALTWDHPTPGATGYRLYWGTESRDYSDSIDVGWTNEVRLSSELPETRVYFALTAYDASGIESDFSNEVFVDVHLLPRGAFTLIHAD